MTDKTIDDGNDSALSTGELARLCGTTVRTVQYYDAKGLLCPRARSAGGRRLYDEEDARQLRLILMLKSLGLGLGPIRGVLESPNRDAVLAILLKDQRSHLEEEARATGERLAAVETLERDLALHGHLTLTTPKAMATEMDDEKARRRWLATMVVAGVFVDIAWIGSLAWAVNGGPWPLFWVALASCIVIVWVLVVHYSRHVTYRCPVCDAEFRPSYPAFLLSNHTPRTRKLTCPCCGERDWCVEHYHRKRLDVAPGQCLPGTCARK